MKSNFLDYFNLREEAESKESSITSKIKLQQKDGSKEFTPFTVDKNSRPNLRILIKAFENSKNVGVGYTTMDKSKGEIEPLLKKKTLYLTGGAVRDHLKSKTPRNYDLVTDATMSEIRMILKNAEPKFTETKPLNNSSEEYRKLPNSIGKNRFFYVSRWDKEGKEIEFTVVINKEKFDLAPFSKNGKSRMVTPDKIEPTSSLEDDANSRDFTINSLYIPLTNSDGDNSDLIDPHGGANHLKQKNIKAINGLESKLNYDPTTAIKYVKFLNRFGDPDNIPEEEINSIKKIKNLSPKDYVKQEFISSIENKDIDPRKFIKSSGQTGLLNLIFPDMEFDLEDIPEDFKGDRWLVTAWVLKDNDPEKVKDLLNNTSWTKQEINDILYLINLYNWGEKNNFDHTKFYDIKNAQNGLSKNKIKNWLDMVRLNDKRADSFLNHDDSDLSVYISNDLGKKSINPKYIEFLGRNPIGNEFELIKKILSTNKFKDSLI